MPDPPAAEIDRLYALPLDDFVPERDALAKQLREDDREAAEAVKKLRKPSVAAWAVNQVRRDRPDELRRLLEVAEELRRVYAGLDSAGARERLAEAGEMQRELIGSLVRCARELLDAGGHSTADATLEKVAETLRAAALEEELRKEVAAGRVVKERKAAGLGPLATLPAPERGAKKKAAAKKGPTPEERRTKREREKAERALAKARAAAEAAEKRLRELD